jgi:pimeloyl-ACP methyl ester carboxylesterase
MLRHPRRIVPRLLALVVALTPWSGCATIRRYAPDPLHRPCREGFVLTADGWRLGIRHIQPAQPDPSKMPVVLCHGLGLNGTFWTITDNHLAQQLAARGYHVFIPDMRGSGASRRLGPVGWINQRLLRETPLLELGDGNWTVDDEIRYDVPAILRYVEQHTGHQRVNWVGHSLGGMLMFGFLETQPDAWRIANFVGMGATIQQYTYPQTQMLRANRALRGMLRVVSTGRIARPMMIARPPGLEKVDRFYYTAANVDKATVDRFYGYTLENPGRGALQQLDPYLEIGRFLSADRTIDYVELLPRVTTPLLMIAGEGDVMSDIPSTYLTFNAVSSPDKTLLRYGRIHGHVDDYGHCDLVWSRHAPREIFPDLIDWLDQRQLRPAPSAQAPPGSTPTGPPWPRRALP